MKSVYIKPAMKMRSIILLITSILPAMAAFSGDGSNDLVAVTSINSCIRLDIRYATTNNFTGQQVYPCAKAYLHQPTALKLSKAQKKLEEKEIALKVYDAYRPLSVQKTFWAIMPDERYVADPAKGSRHNRGSAVDVTLVELKSGRELEMPSGYDDFSVRACYAYTNLPAAAVSNRALLRTTMSECGFIPFETEWWHFDDADWASFPILDIPLESLP